MSYTSLKTSFFRDSGATMWKNGQLEIVDINVPRFETKKGGTKLGLLIEGPCTNIVPSSEVEDINIWTLDNCTGTIKTVNELAEYTLTSKAAASVSINQRVQVDSLRWVTVSSVFKKTTTDTFICLTITGSSAWQVKPDLFVNLKTGAFRKANSKSYAIVEDYGDYFRASVSGWTNSTSPTITTNAAVYFASSLTSIQNIPSDKVITFKAFQVEDGYICTSYVPSKLISGASYGGIRGRDYFQVSHDAGVVVREDYTVHMELAMRNSHGSFMECIFHDGVSNTTNFMCLRVQNTGVGSTTDTTNKTIFQSIGTTWGHTNKDANGTSVTLEGSFDGSNQRPYLNGARLLPYNSITKNFSLKRITFRGTSATYQNYWDEAYSIHLKDIRIWDQTLPDNVVSQLGPSAKETSIPSPWIRIPLLDNINGEVKV